MSEFQTPIDICNRAMQYLGAKRIDPQLGFTEISVQASECAFAYGKLRRAELRRNTWRFSLRKTFLRPVNALSIQGVPYLTSATPASPTMLLSPALWSSTTTYPASALVTDIQGSIWQNLQPANLNFAPGNATGWELYTGPLTVDAYVSGSSYGAGDLVYIAPGDGTYVIYQSLLEGNTDAPNVATTYAATQVYAKDEIVTYNSVIYQSLVDLNYGHQPDISASQWTTTITSGTSATSWRIIAAELRPMVIVYPIGTGPALQSPTKNVFRLPSAWLREAPQDPKAGGTSYLGAPAGLFYADWTYDGDFIISRETNPLTYRFVADITNVSKFDDMFCEALAARIAYSVCEPVTQSTAKQNACAAAYQKWIGEARAVNGIEQGPTEPPLDDFIAARV